MHYFFLTRGTAEEGLDFVSVLQLVPCVLKLFQCVWLPVTSEVEEKQMDASRERCRGVRCIGGKGQERENVTWERRKKVKKMRRNTGKIYSMSSIHT